MLDIITIKFCISGSKLDHMTDLEAPKTRFLQDNV